MDGTRMLALTVGIRVEKVMGIMIVVMHFLKKLCQGHRMPHTVGKHTAEGRPHPRGVRAFS